MSGLPQKHRGAQRVVVPGAGAALRQMIKIKFVLFRKSRGPNEQLAIRASGNCHAGKKSDGARRDEAIIVVGVLADQRPRPSRLNNDLEGAGGAAKPLKLRRKSLSLHECYMAEMLRFPPHDAFERPLGYEFICERCFSKLRGVVGVIMRRIEMTRCY
jgi:hypothetical protein